MSKFNISLLGFLAIVLGGSLLASSLSGCTMLKATAENIEQATTCNPYPLHVEHAPTVGQARSMKFTLHSQCPLTHPPSHALFMGTKYPLFPESPTTYMTLISVDIDDKPGDYLIDIIDTAGKPIWQDKVKVTATPFSRQNIQVSGAMKGLEPTAEEIRQINLLKDTVTPQRLWQEPLRSPLPHCQNSPFGVKRFYNGKYSGNYHKGVDLRAPAGAPIKAITDGRVVVASQNFRLHGGTVGLDHGTGLTSIYIHMSKVLVKPGQMVKAGDTIGLVGSTGFATGPHLHWGLYVHGIPIEPNQWIANVPKC